MNGAFPFAERIAAGDAPSGLCSRRLGAVLCVNLAKILDAHLDGELVGILARDLQELQVLAQAARRRFSSSESMAAAFGLTTQNLPM